MKDILQVLRDLLKHRTEDIGCYEFVLESWIESAANEIERLRKVDHEFQKKLMDGVTDVFTGRRWIPVSERLPQREGDYVLVSNGETVGLAHYSPAMGGMWRHAIGRDGWEITHWMPLPEPPEVT